MKCELIVSDDQPLMLDTRTAGTCERLLPHYPPHARSHGDVSPPLPGVIVLGHGYGPLYRPPATPGPGGGDVPVDDREVLRDAALVAGLVEGPAQAFMDPGC